MHCELVARLFLTSFTYMKIHEIWRFLSDTNQIWFMSAFNGFVETPYLQYLRVPSTWMPLNNVITGGNSWTAFRYSFNMPSLTRPQGCCRAISIISKSTVVWMKKTEVNLVRSALWGWREPTMVTPVGFLLPTMQLCIQSSFMEWIYE